MCLCQHHNMHANHVTTNASTAGQVSAATRFLQRRWPARRWHADLKGSHDLTLQQTQLTSGASSIQNPHACIAMLASCTEASQPTRDVKLPELWKAGKDSYIGCLHTVEADVQHLQGCKGRGGAV